MSSFITFPLYLMKPYLMIINGWIDEYMDEKMDGWMYASIDE